jgi:ATP-dependent helicase/nuclease subunit A
LAREFTEFQQQAIDANGSDICVAAGAGSGKTGVLVERFVRLLTQSRNGALPQEQRAGVEEILAMTFTEKATKEMKTRIVEELNRLGLVTERRQLETAYISTMHGFCSRLLQENPFEAGVDPQFSVLDEPQAKRLLRQTFEEVLAQAYARQDREIMELVAAAQSAGQSGADRLEPLALAVETTLAKLRGAGNTLDGTERHWLLGHDRTAAQSLEPVRAFVAPILAEVGALIASLSAVRNGILGGLKIVYDVLLHNVEAVHLRTTPVEQTLVSLEAMLKEVSKPIARRGSTPKEIEVVQIFQRIRVVCEEAKVLFGVTATREEQAALHCHRLLGLVIAVWKDYNRAKRRHGRLDNDDLQSEGVRLLEESPGVRNRYRRRFRHLLVDEFQDTNPLQMRLIELLHVPRGEGSTAMPPNFLFVVGDVQQSIYAFRHADSTLFRHLERDFREGKRGLHIPLSVNFRSRPEILQTIAQVFRQVWRAAEAPFVLLTCGAPFDPKPGPSLALLLTQDLMRRDYVNLEADALAARIQQMVEYQELRLTSRFDRRCGEPVAYRDVAILLRSLTDIQKYEEAFARRGVPYFVVGGGRGYYARTEIRDLLNVLTVLETPLDDLALAATLRSPLVGADVDTLYRLALHAKKTADNNSAPTQSAPLYPSLQALLDSGELPSEEAAKLTQFVEVIEGLRAQEDRLPVGHLLERLIAQTHYDARLLCRPGGRRRLANVRKLLQMANSDSVMGVREFIRRLRDLEKLSDREGDAPTEEEAADVVRFLTIHGAKGLEFPVVVLADLSRGLLVPEKGLFVCEPQTFALGTRLGGEPNVVYKAIDARREAADKNESERLLYVAMTRAREHLILCGNLGRNRGFNWADNLFPLLGIADVPPEPELRMLAGGIPAQVAPLGYYAHTPIAGLPAPTAARRQTDLEADRLATAILTGDFG